MHKVAFTAVIVAAGLVGGVPSAAASPRATATGSFTFLTDTFSALRSADGNSFSTEAATIVYDGDLAGPAADTDTYIAYKDGSFKGVQGREICTGCTLGGRTGDFTAVFTYAGVPTATGFQYAGHLTVRSATGGLAGLHLEGTFQGNEVGNTYSYNYSFAP